MDKKHILELIKFNKSMQNIFEVNLIDYQLFSHNIIIFDTKSKNIECFHKDDYRFKGKYLRNRKGKEYDIRNNILAFEGEYLNGKRNGKGKEYHLDGQLIFDGEYSDGNKWNGKERLYIPNFIKFEVEYLNGKKWQGKEFDKDNKIIYELKEGKGFIREYISIKFFI